MKKWVILALLGSLLFLTGCQKDTQLVWKQKQENFMTFPDGSVVSVWNQQDPDMPGSVWEDTDIYRLADGTELLRVHATVPVEHVGTAGVDAFETLNAATQDSVKDYFAQQGVLYDIPTQLERAYEAYLEQKENGEDFDPHILEQQIAPTAANESIICYVTTVSLPVAGRNYTEIRCSAVFDRQSGRVLNNWELFQVSEQAAREFLTDAYAEGNPETKEAFASALQPEYITLLSDHIEILLPAEDGKGTTTGLAIGYDKLQGVLQDWAVMEAKR